MFALWVKVLAVFNTFADLQMKIPKEMAAIENVKLNFLPLNQQI